MFPHSSGGGLMAHTRNITGNCSLKFSWMDFAQYQLSLWELKAQLARSQLLTFFFVNHFLKKKGTWTEVWLKTAFP